ncbi:class I SAM-dependent methyltransferase [Candidatus Korarchaeum cryptofilum]|jgi:2-polyprenyl-3-methyl-5-hydroxy-6-metoxy-1,4-benzoquinol methylase|uniref:Methyltransferase type 11 n=2 Tax=Candidatus Korarchaeum cryptofilum TaxID=498846 RepID=B1L3G9_KORCO|nr:Methyltransferase type 11 [Candidatus Korarchaeum cryptofilum OPF8]RSN70909.1 class I SAM-dependent methyltransferase [Candidatus Korarchaeum cryptofilum]
MEIHRSGVNGLSWIQRVFIDRADLYLEIMNSTWSEGEQIARSIAEILRENGLESGRVLEAFCGNGRVAIPLAIEGYDVLGFDISLPFIQDARQKAEKHRVSDKAKFIVSDAREIDSRLKGEIFDAIIIVSTSLGYYDSMTDEEILRKLRSLVKEGSILIIANTFHRETPSWNCGRVFQRYGSLVLMEDMRFDPLWSRLLSKWILLRDDGEGNLTKELEVNTEMRIYTSTELAEILRRAGWGVDSIYGDIRKKEKFSPPCPYLSLIAKAIQATE